MRPIARSQWAVIVDPDTGDELADGRVGEIWLQGDNIGRGYWGRPAETRRTFGARLTPTPGPDSHAQGAAVERPWLRTGDLGFYLDGELYVTGRLADLVIVDGRSHYPQDIEATVADASPMVRRGYVAAFVVPAAGNAGEGLVIVAERAAGTSRSDPQPALDAIREAVSHRHGVVVSDVRVVPAGAIPRTTSGKLARWACREQLPERRCHPVVAYAAANFWKTILLVAGFDRKRSHVLLDIAGGMMTFASATLGHTGTPMLVRGDRNYDTLTRRGGCLCAFYRLVHW